MRRILVFGLASILSACAATGVRYAEHPGSSSSISDNLSRLTVFRVNNTSLYSGRSARVALDGGNVSSLATGGFKIVEVPAGGHTLVVDMWDAPGRCELTVEVQSGIAYFYEVAPRVENYVAGLPGAAIPPFTPASALLGGATMLGGMAAESAGKQCGGAFSIVLIEQSLALPKLMGLRASD